MITSKRLYLILIGAIVLLFIGIIGGTYEINSLLSTKASELTKLKAKSLALDQEQASLIKAKQDIKKYQDLHAITQSVVPEDKNQAEAVREIVNIAEKNNIALASITFPASTLGGGGTSAAGVATPASAQPAGGAASTASSKAGSLSQLIAVKNIAGVYSLTITVTSDSTKPVPYNQFVNFLGDLEHNRRTAQVNTVSIEPKKDNRNVLSFTLTLNEYIKP